MLAPGRAVDSTVGLTSDKKPCTTSGTLHRTAALTAAHCVKSRKGGFVLVGSTDAPSCGGPATGVTIPFSGSDVILHPKWRAKGVGIHDLAVVRLNTPVTSVAPAALGLSKGVENRCERGRIAGWGDTDNRGTSASIPCKLREAEVPMWSVEQCSKAKFKAINCKKECKGLLCAGDANPSSSGRDEPGTSACWGDSGGPLFDCDGRLVGVNTYNTDRKDRCGYSSPDRYVRLGHKKNRRWFQNLAKTGVLPAGIVGR